MTHDLASAMQIVAEILLGTPSKSLSKGKEWRYGKQGSMAVDIAKGVFHDHESDEKGGTLALIKREKGLEGAAAFEWLKSIGVEIEGDRADRPKPNGANGYANGHANGAARQSAPATQAKGAKKIVATYPYYGLEGTDDLRYEVVRFEPKTFAQRIPAPNHPVAWLWSIHAGTFVRHQKGTDWYQATDERTLEKGWGDPIVIEEDTPHGLFNWPEVHEEMLQAPEDRRTVMVPEGEADCLTLAAWGLLATTNSGGAGNWRPDHAAHFAGADVVVLLDNDKAGRARGEKLAASLLDAGAKVRVLDWKEHWPGVPDKGDVTDWRDQAGGTKAKLFEIVDKLKFYEKQKERRFGRLSLHEIRNRAVRAPDYIVEDWMVAKELSFIGGAQQSGKTFLAAHAALSIATGRDVLGRKTTPGLVIYQIGESGNGFMDQRIPAWLQYHGSGTPESTPFEILPQRIDLFHPENDTKEFIACIKAICAEYPGVPLRAIFIDTFAKAMRGADEGKGVEVGKVLENLEAIAQETGAHVCVIHHIPKSGISLRGHTSISNDVDSVVFVENDEETKVRTIKADKIKDGPAGWELRFELLPQTIGTRPDGKEITSCVCVPFGEKERSGSAMRGAGFNPNQSQQKVFRAFLNAMNKHGAPPPSTSAIPAFVTLVVTYTQWKDEFILLDMDPSAETSKERNRMKMAYNRAVYAFTEEKTSFRPIGRHRRGGADDLFWLTGTPVRGFPESYGRKKTKEEPKPDEAGEPEMEF